MAIIKAGILGKFNGSVGNITGYNLGGQQVIRSKAVDVANPNTISQQAQRNNLKYAIEIYKVLNQCFIIPFGNGRKNKPFSQNL